MCKEHSSTQKVNPVEQKKKRKKIEQNNKKRSNEQKDQTMTSIQWIDKEMNSEQKHNKPNRSCCTHNSQHNEIYFRICTSNKTSKNKQKNFFFLTLPSILFVTVFNLYREPYWVYPHRYSVHNHQPRHVYFLLLHFLPLPCAMWCITALNFTVFSFGCFVATFTVTKKDIGTTFQITNANHSFT